VINDLIKRLRSIRGNFLIPVESPPIFQWADEAADALEQMQTENVELSNCCSDYRLEIERLSIEHGCMNEANVKYEKRIEELEAALETLARLGNGDKYGNSDGNIIAQKALAKVLDQSLT